MYWNMSHPGMGLPTDGTAASGGEGEGEEGWEVMYVRLRGKATFPGPGRSCTMPQEAM